MTSSKTLLDIYSPHDLTGAERAQLPAYIERAKAFARVTASGVFLIDYSNGTIPFASSHMLSQQCMADMQAGTGDYFAKHMLADELEHLKEVSQAGFTFIHQQPLDRRLLFTLSFDFHYLDEGIPMLMYRHITPFALTRGGNIWLALGTLAPSANMNVGKAILRGSGDEEYYEYSYADHRFCPRPEKVLKEADRKLLILSAQGYTVEQIASALYRSPETIKTRKQKLFQQLGVQNIAEALTIARNYMLF